MKESGAGPISTVSGGVRLRVHALPRASRSEIVGLHGPAIKIRLAAPPVDGAANTELVRFLAARLRVPAGQITLARGAGARQKTVTVAGISAEQARRRLLGTE